MQKANKAFVNYYFDSLEKQANDLIDNEYRPSLIRQLIEMDVARFKDPAQKDQSLFNAIQVAFIDNHGMSPAQLAQAQSDAMAGMKVFYTRIDAKVEAERRQLLAPLRQQRQQLLAELDANYMNIIRKNATVTALLSSVVKVHQTQQQLLAAAGANPDLRTTIGDKLASLSNQIDKIQAQVNGKTTQVTEVENAINAFRKRLQNN